MNEENKGFLTAKEAAQFLNINEKKIYALAQVGKLPGTKVTGKWLFPKSELEKVLISEARASTKKSFFEAIINKQVLLICGSNDPFVSMAEGLFHSSHPEYTLFTSAVGSGEGLALLRDGFCNIAVSHLYEHETGDFTFPFIMSLFANPDDLVVINLFWRNIGFVTKTAPVTSFRDIADRGLRLINRQSHSGIRTLIEHLLSDETIAPRTIAGYENEVFTHFDVTRCIVNGDADVGIVTESVARYANLHFTKIFEERFDMVAFKEMFFEKSIQAFVEFVRSDAFKSLLRHTPGYDCRDTGKVMYARNSTKERNLTP